MYLRWIDISEYDDGSYRKLFTDVFGHYDESHVPGVTIVASEAGQPVGFMTGFYRTRDCFHIYYAGVVQTQANPVRTAKLLNECMAFMGAGAYRMVIENTNRAAMMAAFRAGFVPMGIKVDEGKTFLEWVKRA